jgi:hypothetical protein
VSGRVRSRQEIDAGDRPSAMASRTVRVVPVGEKRMSFGVEIVHVIP